MSSANTPEPLPNMDASRPALFTLPRFFGILSVIETLYVSESGFLAFTRPFLSRNRARDLGKPIPRAGRLAALMLLPSPATIHISWLF